MTTSANHGSPIAFLGLSQLAREVDDLRGAAHLLTRSIEPDGDELPRIEARAEVDRAVPGRLTQRFCHLAIELQPHGHDDGIGTQLDRLPPRNEAEVEGEEDDVCHVDQ